MKLILIHEKNKSIFFVADGLKEEVHFDKITSRIQKLCYGLDMDYVDPVSYLCMIVCEERDLTPES